VRFVVIGGVAAILHGSPQLTEDLDVCYGRDPENLDSLAAALQHLGAKPRGITQEIPFKLAARTLRNGDSFTFQTRFGPFDCIGTPAGTRGYGDLVANAVDFDVDGLRIKTVALDDLSV
jgi:hypothetical protein